MIRLGILQVTPYSQISLKRSWSSSALLIWLVDLGGMNSAFCSRKHIVKRQCTRQTEYNGWLSTVVTTEESEHTAISMSGGLVMYPFNGTTRKELFQAADTILYRAKQKGKDRILKPEENPTIPFFNGKNPF